MVEPSGFRTFAARLLPGDDQERWVREIARKDEDSHIGPVCRCY